MEYVPPSGAEACCAPDEMMARVLFPEFPHWRSHSGGFLVSYDGSGAVGTSKHVFCGAHDIPGARCYVGQHPLLRLVSLDTSDDRLGLGELGVAVVHLLYCWRCDRGDIDYTLEPDGTISVHGETEWLHLLERKGLKPGDIRGRVTGHNQRFPYEQYPDFFPISPALLTELDAAHQKALLDRELSREPGDELESRHQIGGLPFLVQGADYVPSCGSCEGDMSFLGVVADDCLDERGFTGNPGVQVMFFVCERCRRVRATNVCD